MELLQNGHKNLVSIKPSELPLLNGAALTLLNSLSETHEYYGNIDPSRVFVTKVKRIIVKVLLLIYHCFILFILFKYILIILLLFFQDILIILLLFCPFFGLIVVTV